MLGEARPLRADAQRNRARVLEAAEVILARDGLSASMRTIAQHAGVGLGTIYRHFPTQEALYQAVIIDRTQRLIAEAEALSAADDPGAAFFEYFTRIVVNATQKKTLADVLAEADIDPKAGMADISRDMRNAVNKLLVRAQKVGAVRQDLHMPELLALLAATCMAAERNQWSHELRARTLAILFDGLRPHH
ncbi:transcriptional regulator, TetR family [Streptosporangium subroseum]|uniref:Transcriptional regulator, TetR family n=1 Tax=Streptosporangium subroseum TaxID=106412 RepID=A0A239KQL6_9ACTN|nr:TetR/AcrR family transcriptional regulator [Streptosporangium subroseum]SNT19484.1 transcriptional regulator, TetR family [Streptosporangium subroseum]